MNWALILVCFSTMFVLPCNGGNLKIRPFYFPDAVEVGEKVVVSCSATTRTNQVAVHWLKNGEHFTAGSNVEIGTFKEVSNMVIDPVSLQDEGNYTCVLRDRNEQVEYSTILKVHGKLKIQPFHFPEAVEVGDTVAVTCLAKSRIPQIKVYWLRDGKYLTTENKNIKIDIRNEISHLVIDQ